MNTLPKSLRVVLAAAAFVPAVASADVAVTTQGVNMRAGPDVVVSAGRVSGPRRIGGRRRLRRRLAMVRRRRRPESRLGVRAVSFLQLLQPPDGDLVRRPVAGDSACLVLRRPVLGQLLSRPPVWYGKRNVLVHAARSRAHRHGTRRRTGMANGPPPNGAATIGTGTTIAGTITATTAITRAETTTAETTATIARDLGPQYSSNSGPRPASAHQRPGASERAAVTPHETAKRRRAPTAAHL